jgi:hypothetical protein
MNYIKIDENARILIEDNNYTLEYKVAKGDFQGKKGIGFHWVLGGYFHTLDTLLKDYVINAPSHANPSNIKCLQDVCTCIQEAEAKIEKLIHKK